MGKKRDLERPAVLLQGLPDVSSQKNRIPRETQGRTKSASTVPLSGRLKSAGIRMERAARLPDRSPSQGTQKAGKQPARFFSVSTWSEARRRRAIIRDRRLAGILVGSFLGICVLSFVHPGQGLVQEVPQPVSSGHEETPVTGESASSIPLGFSGLMKGLHLSTADPSEVRRMGTRAEKVLVGQRIREVTDDPGQIDLSAFLENQVTSLHAAASNIPSNALLMSDYDYEALLRIVEAEAGTEDLKGRLLVANVILNRVRDERFPDSVAEVIYSYESGVAQFSPVDDGRLYEVTVTAGTRKAVRMALEGADESRGALFFVQKDAADPDNVLWFENNLTYLFRHGVHDFYTYPESTDSVSAQTDI